MTESALVLNDEEWADLEFICRKYLRQTCGRFTYADIGRRCRLAERIVDVVGLPDKQREEET